MNDWQHFREVPEDDREWAACGIRGTRRGNAVRLIDECGIAEGRDGARIAAMAKTAARRLAMSLRRLFPGWIEPGVRLAADETLLLIRGAPEDLPPFCGALACVLAADMLRAWKEDAMRRLRREAAELFMNVEWVVGMVLERGGARLPEAI